jgi:truncated hemoglobin YjbI
MEQTKMPVYVNFTVRNDNPNTIHNKLKARLGREPTTAELRDECLRIMSDATASLAAQGKLKFQKR